MKIEGKLFEPGNLKEHYLARIGYFEQWGRREDPVSYLND